MERVRSVGDRFWLFAIAGLGLVIVGSIAGAVIIKGEMPKGGAEILTATITGLLMIVQKVIEAQQQRRSTELLQQQGDRTAQLLHQSTPSDPTKPANIDVAAERVEVHEGG